jgi:hypothetical protein
LLSALGLVYYGHRYYSPTLGRFINKDPIEEQGGLNLYGFCGNNGVNRWDYLGMDPTTTYYIAPSEGMFENDGVWDPVAKNWTVNGAQQSAMEGVSWMGQANQAIGDLQRLQARYDFSVRLANLSTQEATVNVAPLTILGMVPDALENMKAFGRELQDQGSSLGNDMANGTANLVAETAKWGLDIANAAVDFAYNGEISDARWTPVSTLTTDARPTFLGLDEASLVSTFHTATFGIPGGLYSLASEDYQAARHYFAGGSQILTGASFGAVRTPNLNVRIPNLDFIFSTNQINTAKWVAANIWDGLGDNYGLQTPKPITLQNVPTLPSPPSAIVRTVDPKPAAGAGTSSGPAN